MVYGGSHRPRPGRGNPEISACCLVFSCLAAVRELFGRGIGGVEERYREGSRKV